jgi:hypothetical protein
MPISSMVPATRRSPRLGASPPQLGNFPRRLRDPPSDAGVALCQNDPGMIEAAATPGGWTRGLTSSGSRNGFTPISDALIVRPVEVPYFVLPLAGGSGATMPYPATTPWPILPPR